MCGSLIKLFSGKSSRPPLTFWVFGLLKISWRKDTPLAGVYVTRKICSVAKKNMQFKNVDSLIKAPTRWESPIEVSLHELSSVNCKKWGKATTVKNGRYGCAGYFAHPFSKWVICSWFLHVLWALACTDEGMPEYFVFLHPCMQEDAVHPLLQWETRGREFLSGSSKTRRDAELNLFR